MADNLGVPSIGGFGSRKGFSMLPEDFAKSAGSWGAANYAGVRSDGSPALPNAQALGGTDVTNPTSGFSDRFSVMGKDWKASDELPNAQGGWMDNAKLGLGAVQTLTGVYSAAQQAKMNKFMRSYYSDQMDLMKTDFSNAARGANEALAGRQERLLSAQGHAMGSPEMVQGVASHMAKWGAKETV